MLELQPGLFFMLLKFDLFMWVFWGFFLPTFTEIVMQYFVMNKTHGHVTDQCTFIMKELSALAFKYPTQSVNSLLSCVVVGALGDDVGSVF